MTKEHLVTVEEGISLEESKKILHQHKIEKLLVVDREFNLKGLITIKDIEKVRKYPLAAKDSLGRLRVGAAVGVSPDREMRIDLLLKAGCDVIVVDTAHGHSRNVIEAVEESKKNFRDIQLIAGNIATEEGAEALIKAGCDADQGRRGAGLHLHNADSCRRRSPSDDSHTCRVQGGKTARHTGHRRRRH